MSALTSDMDAMQAAMSVEKMINYVKAVGGFVTTAGVAAGLARAGVVLRDTRPRYVLLKKKIMALKKKHSDDEARLPS